MKYFSSWKIDAYLSRIQDDITRSTILFIRNTRRQKKDTLMSNAQRLKSFNEPIAVRWILW